MWIIMSELRRPRRNISGQETIFHLPKPDQAEAQKSQQALHKTTLITAWIESLRRSHDILRTFYRVLTEVSAEH